MINTANMFFVGSRANDEKILIGLAGKLMGPLEPEEALNLAAWLVALVDHSLNNARFLEVLSAVQNA